jgi:hypothetical protein
MKKFIIYTLVALITISTQALSEINMNFGAVMQPTALNKDFVIISGARVGLNFTDNFYSGLALYGTTLFKNSIEASDPISKEKPILELNYYGVESEYFIFPKETIHLSVSALFGMAYTYLNTDPFDLADGNRYFPEYNTGHSTMVIKPTINLNLNIKSFYRIVIGVSYRYLTDFTYESTALINDSDNLKYKISSEQLNGFAINMAVRFGGFAISE